MSHPFGSPALDVHEAPDAADRHIDLTGGSGTTKGAGEHREPVTIDLGPVFAAWCRRAAGAVATPLRGSGAVLGSRLLELPLFSEAQPSHPRLRAQVASGEYALHGWRRGGRLVWLWFPSAAGRLLAYAPLRLWLRGAAPSIDDDQPPIAELVSMAREQGGTARVWIVPVVASRLVSLTLDHAHRTGIGLVLAWLGINIVGWPRVLTLDLWVSTVVGWFHHATSVAHHAIPTGNWGGPAAAIVAVSGLATWWLWPWIHDMRSGKGWGRED